jgi:hypothetical protein
MNLQVIFGLVKRRFHVRIGSKYFANFVRQQQFTELDAKRQLRSLHFVDTKNIQKD